jgi:hypothetical protein
MAPEVEATRASTKRHHLSLRGVLRSMTEDRQKEAPPFPEGEVAPFL